MMYQLKIVPDAEPNADGRWIERAFETAPNYDTQVEDGHHVVAIRRRAPSDQPFYMHSVLRR